MANKNKDNRPELLSKLDDVTRKKNALDSACLELKLEAKATRRKYAKFLPYLIALVVALVLSSYLGYSYQGYPYRSEIVALFFAGDYTTILIGGAFLIIIIRKLVNPLSQSQRAFQKIVNAIQTLDKSQERIAYEDAYLSLKGALKNLEKLSSFLTGLTWYAGINKEINQFIEDIKLIVLPLTLDSTIKKADLEDVALALYSKNADELNKVSTALEEKYHKSEPPAKQETMWHEFSQTRLGRLAISLCLGYALILVLSAFYVFFTQQNFVVFARGNPDIIIVGGLIASGITFWRDNRK